VIARAHAERADRLLEAVANAEERVSALSEDDHLQLAVSGGIKRFNADQKWTADLAVANALVAIALALTDTPEVPS